MPVRLVWTSASLVARIKRVRLSSPALNAPFVHQLGSWDFTPRKPGRHRHGVRLGS